MSKAKQEVATKRETLPSTAVNDMMADAGMGMESADKDAFAIPYLGILQALSPQLDETDGAYVEGAKQGMLYNNVTGELHSSVTVLPVAYKREILEWVPRSEGGGLAGRHEVGEEPPYEVNEIGKWVTEEGHILTDTRMHYVLILMGGDKFEPAVISMASSQMKKSKRWMTMMQNFKVEGENGSFTPPTFAVKYDLGSAPESNDKGKWHGWTIKTNSLLSEDEMNLYGASKDFHSAIQAGDVKVVEPEQEGVSENSDKF